MADPNVAPSLARRRAGAKLAKKAKPRKSRFPGQGRPGPVEARNRPLPTDRPTPNARIDRNRGYSQTPPGPPPKVSQRTQATRPTPTLPKRTQATRPTPTLPKRTQATRPTLPPGLAKKALGLQSARSLAPGRQGRTAANGGLPRPPKQRR